MYTLGESILSCLYCQSLHSKTRKRERCVSACNESQKAARSKLCLALISPRNSITLPLRPPTPRGCLCERQWTRVGWARVTGINCVFLLTRVISAHVGEFSDENLFFKRNSNSRIKDSFQHLLFRLLHHTHHAGHYPCIYYRLQDYNSLFCPLTTFVFHTTLINKQQNVFLCKDPSTKHIFIVTYVLT